MAVIVSCIPPANTQVEFIILTFFQPQSKNIAQEDLVGQYVRQLPEFVSRVSL
jgi:hypothetical protein